ncbi:hypothetical protein R1sor_024822 [Riccia sorocarpa]|uniref:Uncharacterized protein n=1 Tax=Riccia sorocarpa TaxID=122646 RepID=A0ABD3GVP6_9MARC
MKQEADAQDTPPVFIVHAPRSAAEDGGFKRGTAVTSGDQSKFTEVVEKVSKDLEPLQLETEHDVGRATTSKDMKNDGKFSIRRFGRYERGRLNTTRKDLKVELHKGSECSLQAEEPATTKTSSTSDRCDGDELITNTSPESVKHGKTSE